MNWHFEQQVDLKRPLGTLNWPDPMMAQGDSLAHEWHVHVSNCGQPMDLSGYTVTGYFDRSDGKMVPVNGSASGSTATVVLPQSVYAAAGPLTGLLRAGKGGQIITLAAGRWIVRRGPGDEIVDPGHVVPSLEELLAKIGEMEEKTNAANTAAQAANEAAQKALDAAERADNASGGGVTDVQPATEAEISDRSSDKRVIVPGNLDYAVKAAMCDGKGPAWTEVEKAAARERIGVKLTPNEAYGSMSQIASVVRANTVEDNARIFPIGDQIIMPWKDMDDPKHNTDETAYQVEWDIVHHGMVTLQDGSEVPGMYLMMHKCSAYDMQFSHPQAFLNCPQGLTAGTYHLTFAANWGNAVAGSTWQFTLTKDVPAGGRLSGFEGMPDQPATSWRVQSWANAANANPIETVAVTSGSEGTDLGTMPYITIGDNGLNGMQQVAYGHNRWSASAIRRYLNSAGTNWFISQNDFDIRPDQYNKHGFMSGFSSDFLGAVHPIRVTTALNTVEGFTDVSEDTFDTFFLPSLEQVNAKPELPGVEGETFEYWRRRLGLSGFAETGQQNVYDGYKIPAINENSAQYVRLRSASRSYTSYTWYANPSGCIESNYYGSSASAPIRFSPVCVIC